MEPQIRYCTTSDGVSIAWAETPDAIRCVVSTDDAPDAAAGV